MVIEAALKLSDAFEKNLLMMIEYYLPVHKDGIALQLSIC